MSKSQEDLLGLSTTLDVAHHDVIERHEFGGALGVPGDPAALGTIASAGTSLAPARADHVHPAQLSYELDEDAGSATAVNSSTPVTQAAVTFNEAPYPRLAIVHYRCYAVVTSNTAQVDIQILSSFVTTADRDRRGRTPVIAVGANYGDGVTDKFIVPPNESCTISGINLRVAGSGTWTPSSDGRFHYLQALLIPVVA